MATIVDMTYEFEEEMQKELSYWNRQYEGQLAELDHLDTNYATLNWRELERLDELLNVVGPKIQSNIEEITETLEAIKEEKKKKFETIKFEIQEKSLQMMYNPERVYRLLDAGLVSFEEEGSFDNL
jgi:hypothetical protein